MKQILLIAILGLSVESYASLRKLYSCREAGMVGNIEAVTIARTGLEMGGEDTDTTFFVPRPTKKNEWGRKQYDTVKCPMNLTTVMGGADNVCYVKGDGRDKRSGITSFKIQVYNKLDGTPNKTLVSTVNNKGVSELKYTLDLCEQLIHHHR
jgi:hypothetical protein